MPQLFLESMHISLKIISNSCHIYRDNSDRSRHFSRTKKPISTFQKFFQIELKATTHRSHGSRFIGIFIFNGYILTIFILDSFVLRANKILEVRKSIFCSHFKNFIRFRIIPRKIFGNIVSWYRKSKSPAAIIPSRIYLNKCTIHKPTLMIKFTKFFSVFTIFVSSEMERFVL